MQLKFVSLNISLCLCRFGSGVTSCPYSKFQDLSLLAVAVLFFCGDVGYFFVSGGRGGTAIESNRISRLRCCTQSVLATFSFLHKKPLSTTSTQFHREKKKLAKRAYFISCLVCLPYLLFVIFLHRQNFWRIKFTPRKRVNYDKIHSKLPIFRIRSVKIYTGQKKFTRVCPWRP